MDQISFYQIEIWRSETIDKNPLEEEKLVTIINYEKNSFEDYYLIQDGISMFYKIKLRNMLHIIYVLLVLFIIIYCAL